MKGNKYLRIWDTNAYEMRYFRSHILNEYKWKYIKHLLFTFQYIGRQKQTKKYYRYITESGITLLLRKRKEFSLTFTENIRAFEWKNQSICLIWSSFVDYFRIENRFYYFSLPVYNPYLSICLIYLTAISSSYTMESPEFNDQIANVTVASGRDAVLECSVNNLGNYRVSIIHMIILHFLIRARSIYIHDFE